MTEFDYWLIGSFVLLLVANTYFQFKLGFSNGTKGGYAVGMYHAVCWLKKNNALDVTDNKTGNAATAADIVVHMIKNNASLTRFDNMEDIKKIAEATMEVK